MHSVAKGRGLVIMEGVYKHEKSRTMAEMTHREFLFDDMHEAAGPVAMDIERMARKDASDLLWHGDAEAVLAFATAMGVRPQIDAAMDAYNRSAAGNPMIIAFESAETFVVDPGVRAALAGAYNDKRGGRSPSYAEALAAHPMHPRKPNTRTMGEAFRHAVASRLKR